jgi:hypothetical protein
MKEGLLGDTLQSVETEERELKEARLHVARWTGSKSQTLDVCLLDNRGELVERTAAPPDADGLRALAERLERHGEPVNAVIESMTGARFVRDTLAEHGWEVQIADAQKVKGIAPLARRGGDEPSEVFLASVCRSVFADFLHREEERPQAG